MKECPKILLINSTPLRSDNNSGNTYINIFSNYPKKSFYYLCFNNDNPDSEFSENYFCYNTQLLLKSVFDHKIDAGSRLLTNLKSFKSVNRSITYRKYIDYLPRNIKVFIEDFIWLIAKWDTDSLNEYLNSIKPDIIFLPLKSKIYTNIIGYKISKKYNIPLVTNVTDDIYTFKQISFSPFYWIHRFISRYYIKRNISKATKCYAISKLQKDCYEKIFKRKFEVLYKGYDFSSRPVKSKTNKPIKIIYAGNILSGRWKTLCEISKIIEQINKIDNRVQLTIYSKSSVSQRIINSLNKKGTSFLGGIDNKFVIKKMQESDIILHVESFNLKDKLATKLSFSTKLVDCFYSARCIFAVGWKKSASINYLIENDAAIVAGNINELENKLVTLINSKSLIKEYGQKAWECGKRNHHHTNVQMKFYNDMINIK